MMWVFLTKIAAKLIVNVTLTMVERRRKTALNVIFINFYWKTPDLHLVPEDFHKKNKLY